MARKLPWTAGTTTKPTTSTRSISSCPPPAKRQKVSTPTKPKPAPSSHQPSLLDFSSPLSSPLSSPRRPRTTHRDHDRRGRIPSTSPPPAPSDVVFMREGLDEDDAYMMVEDEFYDVAKGFTARLHHAEYKRLMREAKERKMAQRQGSGLVDTELPENATHETKQRLKRDALSEMQRTGLREMSGGRDGRLVGSDNEDGEDDEVKREEKKVGDPWAGTTLAGLMGYEPGTGKTSLKGLEGVRSGTRAAQGYGPSTIGAKAEGTAERPNEEQGDVQVGKKRGPDAKGQQKTTSVRSASIEVKRAGDMKSDPPLAPTGSSRNQTSKARPHRTVEANWTSNSTIKKEKYGRQEPPLIKEEETEENPLRQPAPRRKYRKFIDNLDDFNDELFEQNKAAATRSQSRSVSPTVKPLPRLRLMKKEDDNSGGRDRKHDRLDEVPVFLA